ncbi:hypothetical protein GGI12_004983, partial [Dipsacomyces acuminosporus]
MTQSNNAPETAQEPTRMRLPDGLPKFATGTQRDMKDPVDFVVAVENILVASRMSLDHWGPGAILANVGPALGQRYRLAAGTPLTPRRSNAVYQPLPQTPVLLEQGASSAPGMAAKRNRLPDSLPTFDKGLASDVKDPVDYILDVESQIVAARMDIDVWGPSAMITGTSCTLTRMILESSGNKLPSSWTAACDTLLFLCPPAMTQEHARQKLQKLQLDVYQPFYRYTYEFDKLRRIAGIAETDDLAMDLFLRGMPPILCDMAVNYANARLGQDDPVSTLYAYINQAEREFAIRTAHNPRYWDWHQQRIFVGNNRTEERGAPTVIEPAAIKKGSGDRMALSVISAQRH